MGRRKNWGEHGRTGTRDERERTFIADTSPVLNGFVNVGPLPPVDTVSTSVSCTPPPNSLPFPVEAPVGDTRKLCKAPTGWISFTAL